jgi:hypothetical protein
VFVLRSLSILILKFACKPWSLLKRVMPDKVPHSGRLHPFLLFLKIWKERLARDKHSSLFFLFVRDEDKKLSN